MNLEESFTRWWGHIWKRREDELVLDHLLRTIYYCKSLHQWDIVYPWVALRSQQLNTDCRGKVRMALMDIKGVLERDQRADGADPRSLRTEGKGQVLL